MWIVIFVISASVTISMAIFSQISMFADIFSLLTTIAMLMVIDNDAKSANKPYMGIFGVILLSQLLNIFIKKALPFPANLIFILLLLLVAYSGRKSWLNYKGTKNS